jgi:hypothetical protein
VERNLAQGPEPATLASDFKLLAAPCCRCGSLTPPSNKLKGGCWPNFGRLGAPPQRFKRKLLCYLPANAAFNRYAFPRLPPGIHLDFLDGISIRSNTGAVDTEKHS